MPSSKSFPIYHKAEKEPENNSVIKMWKYVQYNREFSLSVEKG
jgi:hypothetical protein